MIAKPIIRSLIRATSTLTLFARILASTRFAVHFHCKPYSIKTRDMLAMVATSARRANSKDRSEFVMRCLEPAIRSTAVDSRGHRREELVSCHLPTDTLHLDWRRKP